MTRYYTFEVFDERSEFGSELDLNFDHLVPCALAADHLANASESYIRVEVTEWEPDRDLVGGSVATFKIVIERAHPPQPAVIYEVTAPFGTGEKIRTFTSISDLLVAREGRGLAGVPT